MAFVTQYWAHVTLLDSRNKTSTVRWRVQDEVDAETWFTAETDLIRNATATGELMAAVAGLSSANISERGIDHVQVDDAAVPPAADDNVYHFDKITAHYAAGIDSYVITIPSRDDTAYNVANDGVTLIITGAGASAATTAFVAAFEAGALAKNGGTPTITSMEVNR